MHMSDEWKHFAVWYSGIEMNLLYMRDSSIAFGSKKAQFNWTVSHIVIGFLTGF